jgi:integrase/recombinase XerD
MLTRAVETYLAVRRAAGFGLRNTSYHLRNFAAFSEARKRRYISTEIAIAWAGLAPSFDSPDFSVLRTTAMRCRQRFSVG